MKGLGKEISDTYQGPDALSHYVIKRLQTKRVQKISETMPAMPFKEEDDIVDAFEEWAVTVHRCQPDEQDKKDVLWQLVRKHQSILVQLLDCDIYSKGDEYSYIRMVYECRKRLNRHSRKSDMAQRYLVEKQKSGEKATEFITRLTSLRTKAFGKKDAQACGAMRMLGCITWKWL